MIRLLLVSAWHFLVDMFGPFEIGAADYIYVCRDCGDTHTHHTECARLYVANCATCSDIVPLDSWGWCLRGSNAHRVANRRPFALLSHEQRLLLARDQSHFARTA